MRLNALHIFRGDNHIHTELLELIKSTRTEKAASFVNAEKKFSHFISAHKLCFNSKIVHFIIFLEPHFLSVIFRKPQNMSKSKINFQMPTSRSPLCFPCLVLLPMPLPPRSCSILFISFAYYYRINKK